MPCIKKKNLMTVRVSMLLKSRASLTCFRACFPPARAKDLSAPRYNLYLESTMVSIRTTCGNINKSVFCPYRLFIHLLCLLTAGNVLSVYCAVRAGSLALFTNLIEKALSGKDVRPFVCRVTYPNTWPQWAHCACIFHCA